MKKVPFILASASPRRRKIMKSFPFPVAVIPSRAEEPRPKRGEPPKKYVKALAEMKAAEVAKRVEEGLVLGADTIVYRDGTFFGKPASAAAAKRMLGTLHGAWHSVYTGVSLIAKPGKKRWTVAWHTRVRMRAFTPKRLEYWALRNHDKAGAYAAQHPGNPFVEEWRGDYDNIVGLPRRAVRDLLAKARKAGFAPQK